jgi:tetraacyldisaccharide 4'-kinase
MDRARDTAVQGTHPPLPQCAEPAPAAWPSAYLLAPLAALYGLAVRGRNAYFDRLPHAAQRVPFPVISVGNLTVGGTGKTPLVIELVSRLRGLGRRPAVLTRGYGTRPDQASDEVLELRGALPQAPVIVNPDRVQAARAALAEHDVDCLVLDDGFQHRRLHRDLDVLTVDALDPWGGARLLPAGRLREPLRGAARAGLFVVTRIDQVAPAARADIEETLRRLAPRAAVVSAVVRPLELKLLDGASQSCEWLRSQRMMPVCAIGNPAAFVATLRPLGASLAPLQAFRDHHRYSPRDVLRIAAAARAAGAALVVTTRKDWSKLAPLWSPALLPLVRLDTCLEILDPAVELDAALREALRASPQRGQATGAT